jgi:hypothetical protein
MADIQNSRPLARSTGIIVQPVRDEVILYDTARDETHLLNAVSARIWNLADGNHTVSEIAENLSQLTGEPSNPELVRFALGQLDRKGLLGGEPGSARWAGLTRREFLSKFALAAAAVPVVQTLRVPSTDQVTSCAGLGQLCNVLPCCPPYTCGFAAPICIST